jgi:predicted O-methyltransferase YrrM
VFSPSEIFEQNKALESIPGNFTLYPHYYDSNPKTLELLRLMISQISPSVVVETGVANGASTRTILKAFQDFGLSSSKLFSLDIDPRVATDEFRSKENFNFILINETRNFSDAMKKVPTIDIFYHDSDHSYANQMHEYSLAWEKLSSNGVLISDDINWSNAFLDFSLKVRKRMFVLNDKTKLCGIIYKN